MLSYALTLGFAAAATLEAGGVVELIPASQEPPRPPSQCREQEGHETPNRRKSSQSEGDNKLPMLKGLGDSACFFMMVALAIHGLFEGESAC